MRGGSVFDLVIIYLSKELSPTIQKKARLPWKGMRFTSRMMPQTRGTLHPSKYQQCGYFPTNNAYSRVLTVGANSTHPPTSALQLLGSFFLSAFPLAMLMGIASSKMHT